MSPTERLAALDRGENPALIARLPSGFALMGDTQFLPGYAMLFAYPEVDHLTDLADEARGQYLLDMSRLGAAVRAATGCRRINYSILGNLDPFLHAHIWPRYEWEPAPYKTAPPTDYPLETRADPAQRFDAAKHADLQRAIAEHLSKLTA
jgi:diadenosine tetraphosphate (Ap4A) HIT family hydrolase